MKHRKTPRWVQAAISPRHTLRLPVALLLSSVTGALEVECTRCARRGRYRVDGLLEKFGDMTIRDVIHQVAAQAGCRLALNPPAVTDMRYAEKCCQIRRIEPEVGDA